MRSAAACRWMCRRVFHNDTAKLFAKVGEIDRVLDILERWKNELKPHVEPSGQTGLFDDNQGGPSNAQS